jgi:hypothetical protein
MCSAGLGRKCALLVNGSDAPAGRQFNCQDDHFMVFIS